MSPPTDPGCVALRWALALIDGLIAGGVTQLVLSPGARSTPLVIAAARRESAGRLSIVPILDERAAAFFALGTARATGRPVAVLATSGSAPAHWYPAVIEAATAGVPLVLLSADRPPRLHGWGANQTIDQTRLFGAFVRAAHDPGPPVNAPAALKAVHALGRRAAAEAQHPARGPVHLNLPFDEPLVPTGDCPETVDWPAPQLGLGDARAGGTAVDLAGWPAGRGLICCGPDALTPGLAPVLWRTAAALALPVLTDPLSGLRTGPAAGAPRITGYDALLRNPAAALALRPDWVLRLGRAPVSKTLGNWLTGLPTVLVDPAGGWSDPSHDVIARPVMDPAAVLAALVGQVTPDLDWLAAWSRAETRVAALADAHLATAPWCEGQLIRALSGHIAAGDGLLCANSLPIRQLDCWLSGPGAGDRPFAVFGNRGASGIDGQLATLAGLNHGGVPTWGLLGDLSLTHDLGSLALVAPLDRPLLVINNGGGRIFDYLPQAGLPGFERLWRTPVAPDLAALAGVFGLDHARVADAQDLAAVLAQPARPGRLIEVVIDAGRSRAVHQGFWALVADDAALTTGAGHYLATRPAPIATAS